MKNSFLILSLAVVGLFIGTSVASANHSARAPGLYFPNSRNASIDNTLPTIIGKVPQKQSVKLPTSFQMESTALRTKPSYYLHFETGKVQGLTAYIDGKQIPDVMGFPQYPRVLCHDPNEDGDTLPSESRCIREKSGILPPVVFFFKPTAALAAGKHTAKIVYDGREIKMSFTIVSHANLAVQTVPAAHEISLDTKETCARGYFHDKAYLNIPLPTSRNKKVMYSLSFPSSAQEKGQLKEVRIRINGKEFNLFFPNSRTFFSGKTRKSASNNLVDERSLFLPVDNLYFADGRKARVWQTQESVSLPISEYFEVFPFDASGRKYPNNAIPRTTTSATSCAQSI